MQHRCRRWTREGLNCPFTVLEELARELGEPDQIEEPLAPTAPPLPLAAEPGQIAQAPYQMTRQEWLNRDYFRSGVKLPGLPWIDKEVAAHGIIEEADDILAEVAGIILRPPAPEQIISETWSQPKLPDPLRIEPPLVDPVIKPVEVPAELTIDTAWIGPMVQATMTSTSRVLYLPSIPQQTTPDWGDDAIAESKVVEQMMTGLESPRPTREVLGMDPIEEPGAPSGGIWLPRAIEIALGAAALQAISHGTRYGRAGGNIRTFRSSPGQGTRGGGPLYRFNWAAMISTLGGGLRKELPKQSRDPRQGQSGVIHE